MLHEGFGNQGVPDEAVAPVQRRRLPGPRSALRVFSGLSPAGFPASAVDRLPSALCAFRSLRPGVFDGGYAFGPHIDCPGGVCPDYAVLSQSTGEANLGYLKTGDYIVERIEGAIEFQEVSFRYEDDGRPILSDVSFSVPAGSVTALVGPSGSGKTTLAGLLPRFYTGYEGSITLDGHELADYTLDNLRSHISLVSQNVVLFNDTVAGNIAYGALSGAPREAILEAFGGARRVVPEVFRTRPRYHRLLEGFAHLFAPLL